MQQKYIESVRLWDRMLLKNILKKERMLEANTPTSKKYQNSKSIMAADVDFILKRLHSFVDSYLR